MLDTPGDAVGGCAAGGLEWPEGLHVVNTEQRERENIH